MVPATNAVIERSASTSRRLKTYLQTTVTRKINHRMILQVHKEMTVKLNMAGSGNQFLSSLPPMTEKIVFFQALFSQLLKFHS